VIVGLLGLVHRGRPRRRRFRFSLEIIVILARFAEIAHPVPSCDEFR
jgi:hypothetical protein